MSLISTQLSKLGLQELKGVTEPLHVYRAMIRDILRGGSMPQPVLDRIIEKADGVPLFIEELTSSMLSEARALLEPICRWFDEGAETADLRRARGVQSTLN